MVTATAGEQTASGTAGADGSYSLDLLLPPDSTDFVTLSATGAGDQSYVQFTSLVGSARSVIGQAQNGTVGSGQNFATNITNVSTAAAVLAQQANGGNPITSDAQLAAASATVKGQDVLDLATALKLAVDAPADHPLPQGQTSTLSLAQDPQASAAFISQVQNDDPDGFAQASNDIAADPDLTQPLPADATPADLTAAVLSTDPGFSFNNSGRVTGYSFNADGSGHLSNSSLDGDMSWSLNGSRIHIAYAAPAGFVTFPFIICNGVPRQVQATYTTSADDLSYLSSSAVAVTNTYTVSYSQSTAGCDAPAVLTSTSALTVLGADSFIPLTAADLTGMLALPVYDTTLANGNRFGADLATLKSDGTGTTAILGKSFTWTLSNGSVTADFGNGVVGHYGKLRQLNDLVSDVYYAFDTPQGHYTDAGVVIGADPAGVPLSDAAVPGRYFQFGNTDPSSAFALRFDTGGTGSQENYYLDNGNQPQVDDSSNDAGQAFRWTIENGRVNVRRTYDSTVNGYTNCVPNGSNCYAFDLRSIVPLAVEDSTYYWIEQRQSAQGPLQANTPFTLLARYYDKQAPVPTAQARADLARVAASRAAKARHAAVQHSRRPLAAHARKS